MYEPAILDVVIVAILGVSLFSGLLRSLRRIAAGLLLCALLLFLIRSVGALAFLGEGSVLYRLFLQCINRF